MILFRRVKNLFLFALERKPSMNASIDDKVEISNRGKSHESKCQKKPVKVKRDIQAKSNVKHNVHRTETLEHVWLV